ncbi:MAG: hypothetical protein WCS32_02645 [Candidatus Izemoplasmatales bacterium]
MTTVLSYLSLNAKKIEALIFDESLAGQVCYATEDFTNSSTNIAADDVYGTSFLVTRSVREDIKLAKTKNWLGIVTEWIYLPKVEVLTYRYPILLDTHGQIVNANHSDLVEDDISPEMLVYGESSNINYTYSISNTEYKSERTSWGLSYTVNNYIGAEIPVNGVSVGKSIDTSIMAYIDDVYEYSNTSVTSTAISYSVTVSNTSSSPYYQGGETIYFQHGTRYLFRLQVIVVVEYEYDAFSYTTGSWFTKNTHYDYDFSILEYTSLYKDFTFYSSYSRYSNPFIYVQDNYGAFVLIDYLRQPNRYYGD